MTGGHGKYYRHIDAGLSVDRALELANGPDGPQGYVPSWHPDHLRRAARAHEAVCNLVHDGNAFRAELDARSPLTAGLDGFGLPPLSVPKTPSRKHCDQCNPPMGVDPPYMGVGPRDCTGDRELPPAGPQLDKPLRRRMYQIRDALRTIGRPTATVNNRPVSRVGSCGYSTAGTAQVGVVVNGEGRARYSGLARCGSIWECPVCSLYIRTKRSDEVRQVVEGHGADRAVMLTLTVRHGLGDDLATMRAQLADAWRAMTRGQAWARFSSSAGVVGTIRALEVTHGRNGWHPHLHVVLLLEDEPSASDVLELEGRREWVPEHRGWLLDRWIAMCSKYIGQDAAPSLDHGISLTVLSSADYLCKLGLELTHPSKRARRDSRSPLEIADDWARFHRRKDSTLWRSYCSAMVGARQLTWSRGLKRKHGIRDRSDLELSAEEEPTTEDRIVATLTLEQWRQVRTRRGVSVRVLELAEFEGRAAMLRYIRALETPSRAPPRRERQ